MIKKTLMCGRPVFFAKQKKEIPGRDYLAVDVEFPIEIFWKIEKLIKEADFLLATGKDNLQINDIYKKIFKECSPYVVLEKDRIWIYEKIAAMI